MGQVADLIGAQGAAAAGVLGPAENARLEERAIEDQLPAALEQVGQANLAVGPGSTALLPSAGRERRIIYPKKLFEVIRIESVTVWRANCVYADSTVVAVYYATEYAIRFRTEGLISKTEWDYVVSLPVRRNPIFAEQDRIPIPLIGSGLTCSPKISPLEM